MKVNMQRSLPRCRSVQFFICKIFREMSYLNLQSFVWRWYVGLTLRRTNMAARNQQKHLLPSFAMKVQIHSWRSSLKIILIDAFPYTRTVQVANPKVSQCFNLHDSCLGCDVNVVSCNRFDCTDSRNEDPFKVNRIKLLAALIHTSWK